MADHSTVLSTGQTELEPNNQFVKSHLIVSYGDDQIVNRLVIINSETISAPVDKNFDK